MIYKYWRALCESKKERLIFFGRLRNMQV